MGLAMISFGEALNELNPDLVLVLGDRYEIFAAVSASLVHAFLWPIVMVEKSLRERTTML